MRLFAILFLASFAAQAQVYKCEVKGRTVYTDQPCNKDAQPMDLPPITPISGSTQGEKQLGKSWDESLARGRKARDKADQEWVEQHDAKNEKADRIRKARVEGKVVKGMTPAQVREVAGEPDNVREQVGEGVTVEIWSYKSKGGPQQTVSFKNGEVHSVSTLKGRKKK